MNVNDNPHDYYFMSDFIKQLKEHSTDLVEHVLSVHFAVFQVRSGLFVLISKLSLFPGSETMCE